MRRSIGITCLMLAALLASACANPVRQPAAARFDLGGVAIAWQPRQLPLAGVDVAAPSWLATTALHYRLLYADAMRRQTYAESQWVAPPAELIERALRRQSANTNGSGSAGANGIGIGGVAGCRLQLDLDELVQVFDSPQRSSVQLEMRASLMPLHGDAVLARKAFAVVKPAASADAHGGVAATSAALQALADEMAVWLTAVARQSPEIGRRCADQPQPGVNPSARVP